MSRALLFGCVLVLLALLPAAAQRLQDQDASRSVEQRVSDLLPRLTLEEKVSMLGGTGFETKPIPRLGIPSLRMTDGPLGVRWGKTTAFPASIALAASWDTALVSRVGAGLGREAKARGRNTLLAPCINIQRVPQGGRNFESFGEDPYLTARMAVSYVRGLQGEGVAATVKHFAVNNQEFARDVINARVSERALREIYLPGFEAAVREAGALAVMDAYNRVNGPYCTANTHLNTEILRSEWGFKGVLMSDWGATHNTLAAVNGGLDLEMPKGEFLNASVSEEVRRGSVSVATIDEKVARILRVLFVLGAFDRPLTGDSTIFVSETQRALNREAAAAGMVLLKNDGGLLPLDRTRLHRIAVIGPNAMIARVGGGGSSRVDPAMTVSPAEGIRHAVGAGITVSVVKGVSQAEDFVVFDGSAFHPSAAEVSAPGLKGEYFANMTLSGKPVVVRRDTVVDYDWEDKSPDPLIPVDSFSVRWTGVLVPQSSGTYRLKTASDDGVRLFFDGRLLIDDWIDHARLVRSAEVKLEAGHAYPIRLEYYERAGGANVSLGWDKETGDDLQKAVEAARTSDVAIVCAGLTDRFESEGFDRTDLSLPAAQVALINAVTAANPRTIVVLNAGAPVLMEDWLPGVPTLVLAWYPGQEAGNAIADLLFGHVTPGGRLPCTFPKHWEDCAAFGNYPGTTEEVEYKEGVFVGYRHFDAKKIEPRFAFGFGLSYGEFVYSGLRVERTAGVPEPSVRIVFTVRNTGARVGVEVPQLYVHDRQPGQASPDKELKAFAKVKLAPGEGKTVSMLLGPRAFAHYDERKSAWTVTPGTFDLLLGSSSRLIRLTSSVTL